MHVFIGGAYNGKRQYVRSWLEEQGKQDIAWLEGELPMVMPEAATIVVAGLEHVLADKLEMDEDTLAAEFIEQLKVLDASRELIVIVTEMGRGIVPIEANARKLRDVCGRFYQQLFKISPQITRIWYGIAEPIK
ncbi:bifunctional adenosylcobinamide kinase/adenosylcobinamide-phosphate guanylyltransferase [Viridibacillus sp. YIM B01967]|uniref:Bifunctional adenosylcobinamide kinase/adenosylcobinamide-phosphate guanylyltransferase n=1 Tax=Viridibacillus soli TaxID=2798301 RepID=A0ABS1H8D8_9BACL|nr:bifunctional adenosylcobinamide kinase/adenosylcobinamide-phosphate guanylyltransferase [Viridibacillus soli]MBK3495671.1 bifunctional adenosylcobinamide kinase/adenosylcobinamide-phosphate guanylyltransferase [Viridibacillus soli]